MHEELITASSELFDSFPHYSMSDYNKRYNSNGSIPSSSIPQSKYSSTESEHSSDYDSDGGHHYYFRARNNDRDSSGQGITVPGISTSASSSESARKRRRRRKRNCVVGSISGGSTGESNNANRRSLTSSLNLLSFSNRNRLSGSRMSLRSYSSSSKGDRKDSARSVTVPVLNSIHDLRHAIGRHRGISGSFTPAIDSVLFSMFYATDIFDEILKDEMSLYSNQQHSSRKYGGSNVSTSVRKDVTSVLRKEVVYSLRTSYFCPASKIVKLAQLIEDNFPLEQVHEPAAFLDLLLSKILNFHHPPFHTYSNGSSSFVHRLHLESRRKSHLSNGYFQPPALTIEQLLQRNFLKANHIRSNYNLSHNRQHNQGGGGGGQFATVPYPALVLHVVRDDQFPSSSATTAHLLHTRHHPSSTNSNSTPIIPNMEIDLTNLISYNSKRIISNRNNRKSNLREEDHHYHHPRFLQQSYNSSSMKMMMMNESITSSHYPASLSSAGSSFSCGNLGHFDSAAAITSPEESRLVKGLKSAWKVMYKYLEHFTTSSSDFTAHHYNHESASSSSSFITMNETYHNANARAAVPTTIAGEANKENCNDINYYSEINHLNASSSLSPGTTEYSYSSLRYYDDDDDHDDDHAKNELYGSFTTALYSSEETFPNQQQQQQRHQQHRVKMELIAVICYSGDERDKIRNFHEHPNHHNPKERKSSSFLPSSSFYHVYCKAGSDRIGSVAPPGATRDFQDGEEGEEDEGGDYYAPWLLYQSRYGVAPQVTLIENFGKWIRSLEKRNHDHEFSLYEDEVPLEIRRVLENSHLLIYKRVM